MKTINKKVLFAFFLITIILIPAVNSNLLNYTASEPIQNPNFPYLQSINRTGKIFSNFTWINKYSYINREQPELNNQPSIYIPNYNLSHAQISFGNITAINYTRHIEEEFSEFIYSSQTGLKYIYQKFFIEMSQYINNISILIQDINNPSSFTDENSWEIAIVNCSNDKMGTPNTVETIGDMKKSHPLVIAAHWEVFDFEDSESGPVFLDITRTNMTMEQGIEKYWFAFRIKLPQDDSLTGGGPKFLYFNPDGEESEDIGEGATFAISPDFYYDAYTINNVNVSEVTNGTYSKGTLNSFNDIDEDRYSAYDANNVTIDLKVQLEELKYSPYTYFQIYTWHKFLNWRFDHYKYIFSFDFYLMVNVSDISLIQNATLSIYDSKGKNWVPLLYDINKSNEIMIYISQQNPWEKIDILKYMDNFPGRNNTLRFKLEYIGKDSGNFNVSINQFKVEVGEIKNLDTIQRYDPLVQTFSIPNNVTVINGSTGTFGEQSIDALEFNDDEYYEVQAQTNNLSFFLTFNVLNDMDNSLWDVDYFDWLVSYPNPIVPLMDIRVSSNVSKPDNLDLAALALYKGNATFDILEPAENKAEWILLSSLRQFANLSETTTIFQYDAGFTWLFLHILNESRNNEANFILIYNTTSPSDFGFNVSINEFSVNFYIQNAISSDISSSLGLGVNSNSLTPSDIGLKNFGIDVTDNGIGKGTWEADIDDADITQGFFEFNITSLWHAIRFDISGNYELFQIVPILQFIEEPSSQYMTGTRTFEVKVFEPGGRPLDKVEIIFEVLNSNNVTIYETSRITNDLGIATASLKFESTGGKFSIRVRFPEGGMYTGAEILSEYIKVVSEFTLFMDEFMRYLPYIIVGLIAAVTFVTVRQIKHAKKRRIWAGEATILDDLLKISYIMIIHKDVGVSIYDKQISLEIDSDLISGFLSAISQFRTEFKKDSKQASVEPAKGKGFEMDYYDFKIVITDGDFVRVALILDGTPSENLKKNQRKFTEQFERRYEANFRNFTGDITAFRSADDLIEKHFNITFVYPLQLGSHYGVIKLKGLEKILAEVAEQIQKERKFFFISSLLNFGLAGRKSSRDEIISNILSLKRKGLIIPAELE
ncbi:hypothetical protein LCGC14_1073620 [marine sediment metagenome]|uniref:Uncharacterized protein n=1 Tax=marine sediment metagenome TaxID=412755 RepID=A0A0F9MHE4_9ZZZZ